MKYLLSIVFTLSSTTIFAQQAKLPQEKVAYMEHYYKCHFCGNTYEVQYFDPATIKNEKMRSYMKEYFSLKMLESTLSASKEAESSECNGSRNGKHTFHEEKGKAKAVAYILLKQLANGKCTFEVVE